MRPLASIFSRCGIFWLPFVASGEARIEEGETLLEDDFSGLRPGMFSGGVVGARAEYHYLPEIAPKGNWAVSCFTSNPESQRAWRVLREGGAHFLCQTFATEKAKSHSHPLMVTGHPLWSDYAVTVRFAPESQAAQSGLVFRCRNDRCYYFFGVDGPRAVLKMVRHEAAYHQPFERTLAEKDCSWSPGQFLTATVRATGSHIQAALSDGTVLEADDDTYSEGKVGLLADAPTRYSYVKITATRREKRRLSKAIARQEQEWAKLQASNPRAVLWKKIRTPNFGVGRNLRFGDLNGDGQIDALIGQPLHHGPKGANSELSCLTAMTFDGEILWQIGEPDPWKNYLSNDVGFQIHDLDGDGRNEVIYCMNREIVVADGATGETKYKAPTPETPKDNTPPYNRFGRILGDSLFFCDFRGTGRPRDMVIKDRYRHVWALNDRLEIMWDASCNTGHYPFAYDVDGDGKDELAIGYSLLDHDGRRIWSLQESLHDHADGVAIVRFKPDAEPRLLCAASDEGIFFADMRGNILKRHYLGHVQNPAVANFRGDLPGLECVSINFWGNQGIVHFYDAEGNIYHDFEPCQHGSMCLPINWNGGPEEFFVLSANVDEGGIFDGWGRRAVVFPGDGHPDMCYAVLDITGDCRDEIVVWDPYEIWVYTQEDNPRSGRLYKPTRNPLYNYSNYQATVSLPGWSE